MSNAGTPSTSWLSTIWTKFNAWVAKNPGFYFGVAAGFVAATILRI